MSKLNEYHIPPMEGSSRFSSQKISGTGTTEAHNEVGLTPGRTAVLVVGAAPVFVSFRKTAGLTTVVSSASSLRLPAGAEFKFRTIEGPDFGALFVYAEAADGIAAYTVDVWQASE